MAYLLGIDLGTSSLKTIVLSSGGDILAAEAVDYSFDSPVPGWAEQDPEVWWDACVRTIRAAVAKAGIDPAEVSAVGFSGQMHGIVAVDRDYNVIRPAILHCDARSGTQAARLTEMFTPDECRRLFRNPIYPGFMLPSLMWMRDEEPANFARVAHVCSPKDYIRFRLTGVFSTECSDASATLLWDFDRDSWSDTIISRTGLPREIFPEVNASADIIGPITAEASALTGLPRSVKAAAGGADIVMMSVGSGLIANGDAGLNIGTSGQVSFQIDRPVINPALNTNMFNAYAPGRYILFGASMSCGFCLKWWRGILGNPSYDEIHRMVSSVAPGSGGVIFYPYLNGERCPHLMSDLSGSFIGVNASTERRHMTRAVMEGVVYNLRQCAEVCGQLGFTADTYLAAGGGARSEDWTQIMADVFNKPIRRSVGEEQSCLGAAITAGVGIGEWDSVTEAVKSVIRFQDRIVVPNPRAVEIYDEYYALFKETFAEFKDGLQQLTNLGRKSIVNSQ